MPLPSEDTLLLAMLLPCSARLVPCPLLARMCCLLMEGPVAELRGPPKPPVATGRLTLGAGLPCLYTSKITKLGPNETGA